MLINDQQLSVKLYVNWILFPEYLNMFIPYKNNILLSAMQKVDIQSGINYVEYSESHVKEEGFSFDFRKPVSVKTPPFSDL